MKTIESLLAAFAVPVIIMNLLGGLVSGIWLLVLGEWQLVIGGILAGIFAPFGLGLVMAPTMLLAGPAVHFMERGQKPLTFAFLLLNSVYLVGIITLWCLAVLWFCTSNSGSRDLIPSAVWSYGVAVGPLFYMASQEGPGSSGTTITCWAAAIGYIVMLFLGLLFGATFGTMTIGFVTVMVIGLIPQYLVAYYAMQSEA